MQKFAIQLRQFLCRLRAAYRQRLTSRANHAGGNRVERTLRLLIEGPQGFNFVTKELDTHGTQQCRREEVDDAAAMAKLSRFLHLRYRLVAQIVEMFQHQGQVNFLSWLQFIEGS